MTTVSSQQPLADTPTGQGTFVPTPDQTGGAVQSPPAGIIAQPSKSDIELARLYKTLRYSAIILGPALGAIITFMLYQVIQPLADVKAQIGVQKDAIEKLETKVENLQKDVYTRPSETPKAATPMQESIPKNPTQ